MRLRDEPDQVASIHSGATVPGPSTGDSVKKEMPDLTNAVWRRSSGGGTTACVEVALLHEGVAVRDSRKPEGPVLFFTPAEWDAFVGGAKDGEFDL